MDPSQLDHLSRAIAATGSRRALTRMLATLPLGTSGLLVEDTEGKRRQKKRRQGRSRDRDGRDRRDDVQSEKKKGKAWFCLNGQSVNAPKSKKKKLLKQGATAGQCSPTSCTAESRATTCIAKCGSVANNCGTAVDCGSCACDPPCDACFDCDETTRTCVLTEGASCGSLGQVCDANGECACTATSCPLCQTCGNDGVCADCAGCCDATGVCRDGNTDAICGAAGESCATCSVPNACIDQACVCPPTTCTAEGKNCGQFDDGCGGRLQCGTCSNPTPICKNNVCMPCTNDDECTAELSCCNGTCRSIGWTFYSQFISGSGNSDSDTPWGITATPDGLTLLVADTGNHRISVWTRPNADSTAWSPQTTFGSYGNGPDQLLWPFNVTVSKDGLTVWVADTYNARISIWTRSNATSTDWAPQTTFGSYGNGPDQISGAMGVAVSSDNLTVWVAESLHRISVWTRPDAGSTAWSLQTTFGSYGTGPHQFKDPYDVAVSSDELSVWVLDKYNNRISVWTRPNADSIAWSPQTTFGNFGKGPSQFEYPTRLAVSADGLTVWVVDAGNARISIWTRPDASSTAWSPQTTFGSLGTDPSQFKWPYGLAVSGDELTLFVTASVGSAYHYRVVVWHWEICPAQDA